MKYTINIEIPGGTIQLEADSQKQVFEELSFWQSLPKICPVDGTPTRLNVRDTSEGRYFELVSTGDIPYRGHVGQNREGGTLFHKDDWSHWTGAEDIKVRIGGVVQPAGMEKIRKLYHNRSVAPAQPVHPNDKPVEPPTNPPAKDNKESPTNPFADPLAGSTPADERLKGKINILFKGQAAEATAWLVEGYTRQRTPDNIRAAISALSPDECDLLADSLTQKGEAIKNRFAEHQAKKAVPAGK